MRSLRLSSIIVFGLLFSSCTPSILKGFRKSDEVRLLRTELYPFFQKTDNAYRFNMQIDFRKNHFSGILLVKPTEENSYRTVFNTHFGMSVFDFEFNGDTFRVNSCMEAINKKKVIRTFEDDLKVLFFLNLSPADNLSDVYKSKDNADLEINRIGKYYYLINTETKKLLKIEVPRFIHSLHYSFDDYRERFPTFIRIKHDNIGLKMQLERIYNE